jgi:hypothetical protein
MSSKAKAWAWTHVLELNETTHVYCYRLGDRLLAVGDNVKNAGQEVARWDVGLNDWRMVDFEGAPARYLTRQQVKQHTTQPKGHTFVHWGPNEDDVGCFPYLVEQNIKGSEIRVELTEFPKFKGKVTK